MDIMKLLSGYAADVPALAFLVYTLSRLTKTAKKNKAPVNAVILDFIFSFAVSLAYCRIIYGITEGFWETAVNKGSETFMATLIYGKIFPFIKKTASKRGEKIKARKTPEKGEKKSQNLRGGCISIILKQEGKKKSGDSGALITVRVRLQKTNHKDN